MALTDDGSNMAFRRDRPRSTQRKQAAPKSEDTFKVSDHTVDEVKDFVKAHPEQAAAVLAAEKAGDERVTLVEWLESRRDDGDDDDLL